MQALNTLPEAITNVFAGETLHYNVAKLTKTIGGTYVTYDFAFAPGYNNIFHNAKGLIRLSIENKLGRGDLDITEECPVEVEAILFNYPFKGVVKFRKINAKNINESVKKIEAWFIKNAQAMKENHL